MKNIKFFIYENFQFLEVKFSIYLNRRVFVMSIISLHTIQESNFNFRYVRLRESDIPREKNKILNDSQIVETLTRRRIL